MFETFEHTADVGLRVRAADLNQLFAEAGQALFSVMVANLDEVRRVEKVAFALEDTAVDELLRKWLGELLYTFHVRRLLFSRFDVTVSGSDSAFSLVATAWGEPMDGQRHEMDVEIKAVTWHGLRVEQTTEGWLAEVIVDL